MKRFTLNLLSGIIYTFSMWLIIFILLTIIHPVNVNFTPWHNFILEIRLNTTDNCFWVYMVAFFTAFTYFMQGFRKLRIRQGIIK